MVKLGDLGNSTSINKSFFLSLTLLVLRAGFSKWRIQPNVCRAPEVWRGLGCWPSSDIWSLGVTVGFHISYPGTQLTDQLAHWLGNYPIFGINDKLVEDHIESWCIAKIDRLVGPLGPPIQNPEYESEFRMAAELSTGTCIDPGSDGPVAFIEVGTLRQELERLYDPRVDPGLLDFIDSLLIMDHTKRPTAAKALEHPYLRSTKV